MWQTVAPVLSAHVQYSNTPLLQSVDVSAVTWRTKTVKTEVKKEPRRFEPLPETKEKMQPITRADFSGMVERAVKPPVQKPSPKSK
jgi:hypothetical protein